MSNINREQNPDSLAGAIRFSLGEWAKLNIHTALPGSIIAYNAETRRADVNIAIRTVSTSGEVSDRAPILNVPVVFPSGGGYSMTFPLVAGDAVLLVFSERSLETWKQLHDVSTPTLIHILNQQDAMAIAGFGPLSITPASTGAVLQSNDGSEYIALSSDGVQIRHSGNVNIEAENITLMSSTLTHNGMDISASHSH